MLSELIAKGNGAVWGTGMLLLIVGGGLYLTCRLGFFQFRHFWHMWQCIVAKKGSRHGISAFASFCTTMAMRIGTGNVAGVAVAVYMGGPGALFWMTLTGMTNSAVCFAECVQGSLYKTRVDGEYRGGGYYCAQRGLGWHRYGLFLAAISMIGIGLFMPAAATYTICDAFKNAVGVPMWISAAILAVTMAITVLGGIKRISRVASAVVPFMTLVYLLCAVVILLLNIDRLPHAISLVVTSAFGKNALIGAGIGMAILQGVKRGTFSSASGMGESTPTAAAAETCHPVEVGLANAAGVWLDTVVVCNATGLMLVLTDCYNTATGYVGAGNALLASLAAAGTNGVIFVQLAVSKIIGSVASIFVAIMTLLFSYTCLISYYYESESACTYLFQGNSRARMRKYIIWSLKVIMPILIFVYGIVNYSFAWDVSDLALGSITWINMLVVLLLSGPVIKLYGDYVSQRKAGREPCYDCDAFDFKGVDKTLWQEIRKAHIEKDTVNG